MSLYEPLMDGFFAVALSFVALHSIHRNGKIFELAALSSIPLLIDADHLLPFYRQGIKAFHSILLISLITMSVLFAGYLKKSKRLERMAVAAYAIGVLSISVDIIEGGHVSFLYPLSTQRYTLVGSGAPGPAFYVIGILLMVLSLSYFLEDFFIPAGTVFRAEPHTGQAS